MKAPVDTARSQGDEPADVLARLADRRTEPTQAEIALLYRLVRDLKRGRIFAAHLRVNAAGRLLYAEETAFLEA